MKALKEEIRLPVDLLKAHAFALEGHKGQKRIGSGEPYIRHPVRVVYILSMYLEDIDVLTAAILHDLVEDTHTSIQDIYHFFGEEVGDIVGELTSDPHAKKIIGKKLYLSNSMNSMSDKAFTIKLADRLDNVLGLLDSRVDIDFVKWYWKETKFILENLYRTAYEDVHYTDIQIKLLELIRFNLDYIESLRRI